MKTHPKDIPLYHLPKLKNLNSPIMINHLDPDEFINGGSEPDRHSFYAIFWIMEGDGIHSIDFVSYEIRPRTLFLIGPGQTHFFQIDTPPVGYVLFFEDDWFQFVSNKTVLDYFERHKNRPALYLDEVEAGKTEQYLDMLHAEYVEFGPDSAEILSHLFQLLLLQTDRFYTRHQPTHRPEKNQIANDFQKLVEERFFEEHRLAHYASALGITTDYLSEHIKERLGVAPSKLIHQRITVEAKRLLAFTDLTSGEISFSLGFNDNAYFSRFFKRETNQTPLQFRKDIREKYKDFP